MREWSESVVSEWGGDRGVRWWSEGVGWVERVGWGVRVGRKRDSGERERVIRDRRIEACKSGVRDWGWLKGCDSRVGCENGERERETGRGERLEEERDSGLKERERRNSDRGVREWSESGVGCKSRKGGKMGKSSLRMRWNPILSTSGL